MSELIGATVRNPAGDKLGEVKDVIVDTHDGSVHYAVLSFGGFLGVGDGLYAMPLSKPRPDDCGRLLADVDKKQLESAPGFEPSRCPTGTGSNTALRSTAATVWRTLRAMGSCAARASC